MRYLLNAGYLILLLVYLPILWFQRLVNGKKRPGLWGKITGSGPVYETDQNRVLFHAVSLGEVQAIRRLVTEFQVRHPDWEVIISTTTQTGMDAAKRQFPDLQICLMPFDFSWSISRFLRNLKPSLLVLAELEIWPNLLNECRRRCIKTCLVNGRMSEKSHRKYARWSGLLGKSFGRLDLVCCQNEVDATRYESLGVGPERMIVSGNLKYDSLPFDRGHQRIQAFAEMAKVQPDQTVLIAGSTQAPEEQIVIDAFLKLRQQYSGLKLLICPRHPERFDEVAGLLDSSGIDFRRRSQIPDPDFSEKESRELNSRELNSRVILLDCMGELKHWWGVGDIAFVGGSFGNRGGQNMMEPLALGNAVCFGPNTRNFVQEVAGLLKYEAAVQLHQPADLAEFIGRCLVDLEFRSRLIENAKRYLQDHSRSDEAAWEITLRAMQNLMKSPQDGFKPVESQAA